MSEEGDAQRGRRDAAAVRAEKERRAALLAKQVRQASLDRGSGHERFLVVGCGRDRYGLPLDSIETIRPKGAITLLPRVPAHVLGLTAQTGEVLTVVDLGRLLRSRDGGDEANARIVVVSVRAERVALRVDEVVGIVAPSETREFTATRGESWLTAEHVKGLAEGSVLLLDIVAVLADPRVAVGSR